MLSSFVVALGNKGLFFVTLVVPRISIPGPDTLCLSLALSLRVCSVSIQHAHTHTSLSLSASAQFLFSARAHTQLSLSPRLLSFYSARTHTHISLSLFLHLLSFCSARVGEEQSLIQLNRYCCLLLYFTCKYSQNHSSAIVIILWVFYLIRQQLDYKDFCADEHIVKKSYLCSLNGSRFNHFFIFIPLSDNRNSKIYK